MSAVGPFQRLNGLPRDDAALGTAIEKTDALLDVYEIILSKQKYIAGDVRDLVCFSVAA